MIRTLYRAPDGTFHVDIPLTSLPDALRQPEGLVWVTIADEPNRVVEPLLRQVFGFHPLAVDDALNETHLPKVDDWGDYLYLVLRSLEFDARKLEIETPELDIFIGKHYLVTYQQKPMTAVQHIWETCQQDERYVRSGADHLLYRLIDELVTSYIIVLEQVDDLLDDLEDEIFARPNGNVLTRLFPLKRVVITLRRTLGPQREMLNKLARDEYIVIDARERVFFRDIYDHLMRLHEISEGQRDLVGGALDTYLSVVNNRMNDIMKTLTIITTFFMPLTFLTGFFGMNFFQAVIPLPGWTGRLTFSLTLIIMFISPAVMYWWMRRRDWM